MKLLRSILAHLLDPRPAWIREESARMDKIVSERREITERMQELLRKRHEHYR